MESLSPYVVFGALLAAVGLVAGALAGLLGVGGGIVIVPALYHTFSYLDIDPNIRMHLAVGTSLATIIPTALRSVAGHRKKDAVDMALLRTWAPPLLIGVIAGTTLAGRTSDQTLTLVFAIIALGVSLHMAFARQDLALADHLPTGIGGKLIPTVIGAFSAMMGIGGGTLSVPILTLFRYPIHRAVATSAGFGLVIAVPATVGFVYFGWQAAGLPPQSYGYVNLLGFLVIVPAAYLSVPLGVRMAHTLSPKLLRKAFAFFLAATALRMMWDSFGALIIQ